MTLRKVPNTEDNKKKRIKDFPLVWTIVCHKPITLWLLCDLRLLSSLASPVLSALDDIRNM